MRNLVNTIKHGLGRSIEKIRKEKCDDTFLDSQISRVDDNGQCYCLKEIDVSHTTLNSEALNVDGKLQEYFKAVKEFWFELNKIIKLR